jgi:hypothetical protein
MAVILKITLFVHTPKLAAVHSFEMSVTICQTTRRHITEFSNLIESGLVG